MYQIKCDDYIIYDSRDPSLIVQNPKIKVAVNSVGEGSFTIYQNHPFYGNLRVLKSIFEVSDESGVIFRGRMTENSHDFYNTKAVDLEGLMAFFNDSVVSPYNFPEDFSEDENYIAAAESGNVVEFFLNWLIENHNSQVQDFQKFKLGTVTVSDPNNYITRSDSNYPNTWKVLEEKLFKSSLGGYLCIRYEPDGNYIDYLSDFQLTNTQEITYGVNLLDIKNEINASETYSAIIPIGAEIEEEVEGTDESGEAITETVKRTVTLSGIEDGDITDDIAKVTLLNGVAAVYSKSSVENYGWKCAPVEDTTWEDVTEVSNLLNKSIEYLSGTAMKISNPVEFSAADLHFSDSEIRSFRIYRNIRVNSLPHNQSGFFPLESLEIDLLNPQNTKITVGETRYSLTDKNSQHQSTVIERIETAEKDIEENRTSVSEVKNQLITQSTQILNTAQEVILSALESYVATSNYEEFKKTVETKLSVLPDEISMKFTETLDHLKNVDGELQGKFQKLSKYIKFSGETAIEIGSGDSKITLEIDNEKGIIFKKNGAQFGWWDGVDFHTGNIIIEVNERAQFGNFAFVPRSDGSLSFLKVR